MTRPMRDIRNVFNEILETHVSTAKPNSDLLECWCGWQTICSPAGQLGAMRVHVANVLQDAADQYLPTVEIEEKLNREKTCRVTVGGIQIFYGQTVPLLRSRYERMRVDRAVYDRGRQNVFDQSKDPNLNVATPEYTKTFTIDTEATLPYIDVSKINRVEIETENLDRIYLKQKEIPEVENTFLPAIGGWGCLDCKHNHGSRKHGGKCLEDVFGKGCGCTRRGMTLETL